MASFLPIGEHRADPAAQANAVLAELEANASATPALVAAATAPRAPAAPTEAAGATPAGTPTPRPAIKSAAPLEAQAVSGFRSIGGGQQPARPPASTAAAAGPWSLLILADAALSEVTGALKQSLTEKGIGVREAAGPDRPDAVLVLKAGAESGAWYCDSPGGGSAIWAASLLAALPARPVAADAPDLSCAAVQGAWARTPSSLVALQATGAVSVDRLAEAVAGYFARYGAAQRRFALSARVAWPATGAITSAYGPGHPLGIDIGQWSGPVRAATDGAIYFAGGDPCCSYGRFVVIDNGDGIRTLYGHLASLAVKTGDRVSAGQPLGEVGCTGACDGVHLHFEVIDSGMRQDPMGYLR